MPQDRAPLVSQNVSDVGHPDLIGGGGLSESQIQQIRCDGQVVLRVGGDAKLFLVCIYCAAV